MGININDKLVKDIGGNLVAITNNEKLLWKKDLPLTKEVSGQVNFGHMLGVDIDYIDTNRYAVKGRFSFNIGGSGDPLYNILDSIISTSISFTVWYDERTWINNVSVNDKNLGSDYNQNLRSEYIEIDMNKATSGWIVCDIEDQQDGNTVSIELHRVNYVAKYKRDKTKWDDVPLN